MARLGRFGEVGFFMVRLGRASRGCVRQARLGSVGQGKARFVAARQGLAGVETQ